MNSVAANGDTGLESGKKGSEFKARLISAVILAPAVLAIVYLGSPWFELLVIAAVVMMGVEWRRMACGNFDIFGYFLCALVGGAAICTAYGEEVIALGVLALGVAAITAVFLFMSNERAFLTGAALVGIGATGIGLIWMQGLEGTGLELLLWLLITVWVTDTAAYFSGKLIGGPRLAPKISPNKTWAGLIGGTVFAALWGAIFASGFAMGSPLGFGIAGFVLALSAQAGDLAMSSAKRQFAVKDSGKLIPGHGGLLDRLDGLIGTVPLVAAIVAFSGGDFPQWI